MGLKINKQKILRELQGDLRSADSMQKAWKTKREQYLSETYANPYGNEQDGKSKIVSKDILKQLNWMIPTIADPFLSTTDIIKCNPVTFEDTKAARQSELLLNTQFVRKFNRYNFINKALRVLATEGTVIIQTGWDYEDEEVEVETEVIAVNDLGMEMIVPDTIMQTKILKNQPTAIVCRNEDIFIDPTCMDDMDKCQFVIHRYETDLSTLKADGRFSNLDKIDMNGGSSFNEPDFMPEDETKFRFKDEPRQKLLVYEYWGNYDIDEDGEVEPIVCSWVGQTIIRLEENPYPDKKPPFLVVPFNSVPFQLFGEALAEVIGDNQKVKTAITRGLIDNMAKSNNGQIGMRKGALDITNRKRFVKGENFEFNGSPGDFWQGSYNQIPSSAFDMLALQNNEIESQTGTKSFSGGISGNSLGNSATGVRSAMDATSVRRIHLVRNIAENMIKPLMRKWLAYDSVFLEEEEIVRITNEEFVPIKRDDLSGNLDIDINISTAEDNAGKSQELSFLLQTLGNSMPFEITQLVIAEIAKLSKMPDLEKKIRDFKQQPDPAQEQLKQLDMQRMQMEIEKLKADVADKNARAAENKIDAQVKVAKAKREEAQARAINSKADLDDLQLLKQDNQVDEQLAADEKELDRQHQMRLAYLQRDAGDKNIGIK